MEDSRSKKGGVIVFRQGQSIAVFNVMTKVALLAERANHHPTPYPLNPFYIIPSALDLWTYFDT